MQSFADPYDRLTLKVIVAISDDEYKSTDAVYSEGRVTVVLSVKEDTFAWLAFPKKYQDYILPVEL